MQELDDLRAKLAGRNLKEVAKDAQVGESWLRMWVRGEIPSPAYWRVQRITEYLAAKERDPS